MRPLILLFTSALFLVPARADALTIRDLLELSKAGLGDEVLLALIEVDGPVFSIDTATIKSMKAAGLSERVISAAIRSGRAPVVQEQAVAAAEPAMPAAPEPQVIVIEHHDPAPAVREVAVPVAVPVYIPIATRVHDRNRSHDPDPNRPHDNDRARKDEPRKAEPVYWGWGGKRRPDAWKDK